MSPRPRVRTQGERLTVIALQKGLIDGYHLQDLTPRPPRRRRVKPDAAYEAQLERDMAVVWQTHEATSTWPAYRALWPDRTAFRRNWPLLAFDLVVADWKIRRAASPGTPERTLEDGTVIVESIPAEILDPPPAPEREPWQARYVEDLAEYPVLGWALQQSLGEVFRRAKLSPTHATALRMWLEGESDTTIAKAVRRRSRFVPELRSVALQAVVDAFRLPGNLIASESCSFNRVGGELSA